MPKPKPNRSSTISPADPRRLAGPGGRFLPVWRYPLADWLDSAGDSWFRPPATSGLAYASSKEATENFALPQKSACKAGGSTIEERSRPTGSSAPPDSHHNSSGHLDPPKKWENNQCGAGISDLPSNRNGDEKKLLTGCFERIISRPRRRRRAHCFQAKRSPPTSNMKLVRNLGNRGTG